MEKIMFLENRLNRIAPLSNARMLISFYPNHFQKTMIKQLSSSATPNSRTVDDLTQ